MLKNSVLTLLLAHGMAAMAQTVSGNVFCAGMTFDPAPASVSISGTVAASDVGLAMAVIGLFIRQRAMRFKCQILTNLKALRPTLAPCCMNSATPPVEKTG